MGTVEVIGVVVAGVAVASVLCVIAVGIAVGWVRRGPRQDHHGEHPHGV